ncbi:MAG: pyruvate kinase [SAR202 cluster bacterium]|nr:pyruvate kinase [SAR202 cluster bacterium]|tara:strand:- start:1412 stop:2833 length:1422 start_codon:yes stop_codon:yes gene_type:complete
MHQARTKIVCTLGPSTPNQQIIERMIKSGMSIARLNMSHGSENEHLDMAKNVRRASKHLKKPIGIMVDVPGTKFRIGPVKAGVVNLGINNNVELTSTNKDGNDRLFNVVPEGIEDNIETGDSILIDDGLIELKVISVEKTSLKCSVIRGGRVTEGRGVASPGKSSQNLFPSKKATQALEFAAKINADFVALSTITNPEDVITAREILLKNGCSPFIISKIERQEAMNNFDSILSESDGIMVARGDLGVDVQLAKVPVIQKEIITKSNAAGKPVITATQMLESMINSSIPTRAEVTDVANAIFDGTDAIMLSGETSIGKYPVESTQVMTDVALHTEPTLPYEKLILEKQIHQESKTDDVISYDACQSAHQLNAKAIIAFTESGSTAGRVSKYRPKTPILALTASENVQRLLTIRWGVTPITTKTLSTVEDFFDEAQSKAIEVMDAKHNDKIVLVAGLPIGVAGGTNLMRVLEII